MSKKVEITISMEELEKVKKMYDTVKASQKDFDVSFDEYLQKLVETAFTTHLQFSEMNESMNKVFKNFSESMGIKDDFKLGDSLKDLDSMVQEIFKGNLDKEESKKDDSKKEPDKKIKN